MNDEIKTVAELTVYFKNKPLTTLILDKQETGDKLVEVLTGMFNEKGKKEISFDGKIKTVYSEELIAQMSKDAADSKIKPTGTILDLIHVINKSNR
jgi:hypothetical protein